jgi:hypothetical protein
MSQQETIGSAGMTVGNLAELARQAYEQKRTKDCLDYTRAILLMDPENSEAQLMRSSIRSELRQDLESASALLRHARARQHNPEEPAAPDTEAASATPEPAPVDDPVAVAPVIEKTFDAPARAPKRRWLKRASVIVFAGLVVAGVPRFTSKWSAGSTKTPVVQKTPALAAAATVATVTTVQPQTPPRVDWWLSESEAMAIAANEKSRSLNAAPVPPPQPAALRDKPATPAPAGTLAISSPTSVEIYMDDTYVGSAPVSLELTPGMHTLEYRHGALRRRVTHAVASNEVTRANIGFDVTVQVNSKPWAEVFIDGVEKRPLGQTPLSGLRVPIGSVLVFENPAFRAKRFRVTGNEAGIQNVFP